MTSARIVQVHPGEVHCSEQPRLFRTILGSCVAVCLWDEVRAMGGMNHFVLPRAAGRGDGARFGDVAVPILARRLRAFGCGHLVAKIFGGAAVLPAPSGATVGESNIRVALELLTLERIPVVAQRTGGTHGVVLQFASLTGDVQLRRIQNSTAA